MRQTLVFLQAAVIFVSVSVVTADRHAAYAQIVDDEGLTRLMQAARDGEGDHVKALLKKGGNVNAVDSYGWTALIYAAVYGDSRVVDELLKAGADANAKTSDGYTALLAAIQYGYQSVAESLIAKAADVNGSDKKGLTPLISAAQRGHASIVKLLLENHADANASDQSGNTALTFASRRQDVRIIDLLKKSGAVDPGQNGAASYRLDNDDDEDLFVTKPIPRNAPRPNYTERARQNRTKGVVRVRILIGTDGEVKQIRVIKGLPDGLTHEAVSAARQMRFRPAAKDGVAVAFWKLLDIYFNLK